MKMTLSMLALMSAILVSCTKSEINEPVYEISISPKELIFEADGGEKYITITSSGNWEIFEAPEWITVSEQEGNSGAVVAVTAECNYEAEFRAGEILFTCGDKKAKVLVTQKTYDIDSPIQFKDQSFLDALLETYTITWNSVEHYVDVDKNNDGQISAYEASLTEVLYIPSKAIQHMDEIRYFTALEYLSCYNNHLTSLDLSGCTDLRELKC